MRHRKGRWVPSRYRVSWICYWNHEGSDIYRALVKLSHFFVWWVYAELPPFYHEWLPREAINIYRQNMEFNLKIAGQELWNAGIPAPLEGAEYMELRYKDLVR